MPSTQAQHYVPGVKYTLILSISPSGVESYQLLENDDLDGDGFANYLENLLFPQLSDARVLLWDGLGAHKTAAVRAVVNASPHTFVCRPPFSPDLGPIECPFQKIKCFLRLHSPYITHANLRQYIIAGIHTITPQDCYFYFHHCGYR